MGRLRPFPFPFHACASSETSTPRTFSSTKHHTNPAPSLPPNSLLATPLSLPAIISPQIAPSWNPVSLSLPSMMPQPHPLPFFSPPPSLLPSPPPFYPRFSSPFTPPPPLLPLLPPSLPFSLPPSTPPSPPPKPKNALTSSPSPSSISETHNRGIGSDRPSSDGSRLRILRSGSALLILCLLLWWGG